MGWVTIPGWPWSAKQAIKQASKASAQVHKCTSKRTGKLRSEQSRADKTREENARSRVRCAVNLFAIVTLGIFGLVQGCIE